MTDNFEIVAQLKPAAATLTDFYTVPTGEQGVYHISVANTGDALDEYRISVGVGGAADDLKQYIAYNVKHHKSDFHALIIGLAITAGDVVRVFAKNGKLSFTLYGITVT